MLLRRVPKEVMSLLSWHNAIILMPQIFDVTTNENARYKCYELELCFNYCLPKVTRFLETSFHHFIFGQLGSRGVYVTAVSSTSPSLGWTKTFTLTKALKLSEVGAFIFSLPDY